MTTQTNPLTLKHLKQTDFWLFYRKDLRIRGFKPLFQTQTIYKDERGIPRSIIEFFFEQKREGHHSIIVKFNVSKSVPMYITVAQRNKVFKSEDCQTLREFEREFCQYFKRSKILPLGVTVDYK